MLLLVGWFASAFGCFIAVVGWVVCCVCLVVLVGWWANGFHSLLFGIVVVCVVLGIVGIMLDVRLVASGVISFCLLMLGLWLLFGALVLVFSGFGLGCVWCCVVVLILWC